MIRIVAFSGEIPSRAARLLPENAAQRAMNARLKKGVLSPFRTPAQVATLGADAGTIHLHGGEWLGFPDGVDVVPGPIADDRLYITGDGAPKLRVGAAVYDLAVAAPSAALGAVLTSGPVDSALSQTILYTYTWVSDFGEESEPAPVSAGLLWSPGLDVHLTGFEPVPAGRAISRQRIYRSQTSSSGVTSFYFVHERDATEADFIDVVADNPIQESLKSADFTPPPAGLKGVIALPNGMMAAFSGKNLYFCEPWQPHAWPEKYVLTTNHEIVGLGAFGSSIAVLTTGFPYIVQGTAPDNMTMERTELNLPCIAAAGIVDLGYQVAYPSTEGLAVVGTDGARLVTRDILDLDDWAGLNPAGFRAAQYEGRYVASFSEGSARQLIFFDITGQQPYLLRAAVSANALFFDLPSGRLFLLDGGRTIKEWDPAGGQPLALTWRSKVFHGVSPVNYGVVRVEGVEKVGRTMTVRVFGDGVLRASAGRLNTPRRLPAGFLATTWEVEVVGTAEVTSISLASSPTELAEG